MHYGTLGMCQIVLLCLALLRKVNPSNSKR